jgi:hypothetical protein
MAEQVARWTQERRLGFSVQTIGGAELERPAGDFGTESRHFWSSGDGSVPPPGPKHAAKGDPAPRIRVDPS